MLIFWGELPNRRSGKHKDVKAAGDVEEQQEGQCGFCELSRRGG